MKRAVLVLALLLSLPAAATSSFPGVIRDTLGLDASPTCTVCHTTPGGGSGTATKPFAESLGAAGLQAFNNASLEAALAELEANGTDSDSDGVGDIDELRAGADPNGAGGADGGPEPEPVQYGFGCTQGVAGAPLWLSLLAVLAGRRRARRLPSHPQTVAACSMSSSLAKA